MNFLTFLVLVSVIAGTISIAYLAKTTTQFFFWFFVIIGLALVAAGCSIVPPQEGGKSSVNFGGGLAPSSVRTAAPQNPQTPTTQDVTKTVTREFAPADPEPESHTASLQNPTSLKGAEAAAAVSPSAGASFKPVLVRETVHERAVTQTGVAQKDSARDLGARLANMRGVMWAGVALLVGGPIVGWKMGWFTNGCIAGAVGLGLIILAQVLPGNEAWLGLFGLLLIPAVAFVYYRARHDATNPAQS